jgi:hypothetical protein
VSERAAYSRVYWSVVDDPKFATIFDSDPCLAAWLRLLLIADQAHPASGHLPSNVRRNAVIELERVGLIDLTGNRFRIRGLDAERERRRLAATSRPRTVPTPKHIRVPDGTQTVPERGARRDEDETRTRREDPPSPPRPDVAALQSFGYNVTTKRLRLLDEVAERHDLTGYEWAAKIIRANRADPIGAVIEADRVWKAERRSEADAQEREAAENRRGEIAPNVRTLLQGVKSA